MVRRLLFMSIALCLLSSLYAQEDLSWRKHRKRAEEAYENRNYSEAAYHFESAWKKKQKKEELIYKAGESYYMLRDYNKAAEAFENVKDLNDDYPLVGLKYARSLKQDGQYQQAISAFRSFRQSYSGSGKDVLENIIETEIQGCELAAQMPEQSTEDLEVQLLGVGVNSESDEFAPISFADQVLYFSSTRGNRARIYRSEQNSEGEWLSASIPQNFPVIQGEHYCHGTLTPDGNRFYFTICSVEEQEKFNNLSSRCEIFVIKRVSGSWSQPERLPANVNAQGATATQPQAVRKGNTEFLYFASNRGGGQGGMDLWYTTRNLAADNNDFSDPVNLGSQINTLGDEMTPFIDPEDGTLYFASNGHPSIGGFDIFKTTGATTNWETPENIGLPFNSSADDYYYTKNRDGNGYFLASNRIFASAKLTTRHDDIFEIEAEREPVMLQANVYDQQSNLPLEEFTVTVYRIQENGDEQLLYNRPFQGGSYSFELIPDQNFRVVVESEGYRGDEYQISTTDPAISNYGQPLYLEPQPTEEPTPDPTPPEEEEPPRPVTVDEPRSGDRRILEAGGETYTSRATSPADNYEFTTDATRYAGLYYKIQLISLRKYDPDKAVFDQVRAMGTLDTEYITARNLTRVLLSPFFSEQEAIQALRQVKERGFPSAFIVRYEDGQRYGRVNL